MANTRIGRTVSVAGSRRKATFSAWVKRTGLEEAWIARFGGTYSESDFMQIGFNSTDNCFIVGTSSTPRMECTRRFRDTNAWYHYVVAFDTEQSIASNRLKFYINGEQITSFGTATYPTLNQDLHFNKTGQNNAWLGGRGESSYEFNGLMSHVHWIDGTQYAASDFGETDATTGEWKIKTSPSVTYGENGFFVLKDGSSLTDQSGEGNNLTLLVGTLTNTEDCPSDVFATLNPLYLYGTTSNAYNNGNTAFNTTTTAWGSTFSTLGMTKGKFYAEMKVANLVTTTGYMNLGIQGLDLIGSSGNTNANFIANSGSAGMEMDYRGGANNNLYSGGGSQLQNTGVDWTNGDIVGLAVDMDNKGFYIHKNGTYLTVGSVGDPTSGATKTGAITIPASITTCGFAIGGYTDKAQGSWNFGNGYFGTSAIASEGTNASGIGKFEYDVPTGYTALSTKGLNS